MAKYKKRKDGRYLKQIQIGYKEDGSVDIKNIYGRTIEELENKIAEFKHSRNNGIVIRSENTTFGEWAQKWLVTYKSSKAETTYDKYKRVVDNHFTTINSKKLKNIKPYDIQTIIRLKQEEGITNSLRFIWLTVKQILDTAVENELVAKNVAVNIELPEFVSKKKRPLTADEVAAINEANISLKERAFTELCLYAGMRKGEALALKKDDIDLNRKKITINKTLYISGSNTPKIKDTTKSKAGVREIPLTEPLATTIEKYLQICPSKYIFDSRNNELMTKTAISHLWDMVLRKMNEHLPEPTDISPHYLRHTYATNLYYAGVDVKTAQYLLGHSDIKMTLEIYTHLKMNQEDVTNKLETYYSSLSQNSVKQII